jgi:hypothetical protein
MEGQGHAPNGVANRSIVQAIRFQILRPECFSQHTKRAESKDCARNYSSNDRQIHFHDYSLLNFHLVRYLCPA